MIIGDIRDEPFYLEDLIELMVSRDEALFTEKQRQALNEDLCYLFENISIPKEYYYCIFLDLFNLIYKFNDDEHKRFIRININNGNSPSKQIKQDITIMEKYQKLLCEIYGYTTISKQDNEIKQWDAFKQISFNAPHDVKEHFKFIEALKVKIQEEGTKENQVYYKPTEPTKEDIKQFFKEVEDEYEIKLDEECLTKFILRL